MDNDVRKKPLSEYSDQEALDSALEGPGIVTIDAYLPGATEPVRFQGTGKMLSDSQTETEKLAEQVAEKTAAKLREKQSESKQPKAMRGEGLYLVKEKLPPKKDDFSELFDYCKLSEKQRNAASLRLEYKLSVSQISKRLGITRPAVDKRLALARKKMNEHGSNLRAKKRKVAHRDPLDALD
jgi:hypothetical protein